MKTNEVRGAEFVKQYKEYVDHDCVAIITSEMSKVDWIKDCLCIEFVANVWFQAGWHTKQFL